MLLPIRQVEKPWGIDFLPEPFNYLPDRRIGEIWFEPPLAVRTLLVKYIFATQALSVQVHPSDTQTISQGIGRQGKEECWLIIAAEPGARLGIGFDSYVDPQIMRAAALDGSIETMLTWHEVAAGDFFYIPANTVHAIGAGVSLIEVQQNSDITYRLYDYGRPRELHLDAAVEVACGHPYDLDRWRTFIAPDSSLSLVDGPLFKLDQIAGRPSDDLIESYADPVLIIPRSGEVIIDGHIIRPGQCAVANRLSDIDIKSPDTVFLAAKSYVG
jgi:mannose-6-phosphate isomerase